MWRIANGIYNWCNTIKVLSKEKEKDNRTIISKNIVFSIQCVSNKSNQFEYIWVDYNYVPGLLMITQNVLFYFWYSVIIYDFSFWINSLNSQKNCFNWAHKLITLASNKDITRLWYYCNIRLLFCWFCSWCIWTISSEQDQDDFPKVAKRLSRLIKLRINAAFTTWASL